MMLFKKTIAALAVLCLLLALSASAPASARLVAQDKDKKAKKAKQEKPDKKEKKDNNKDNADQSATVSDRELHNVMWSEPSNIESLDLFNGAGGADGAPEPQGKFTFEKRVSTGTSEKIRVKDDKGREWTVKFGPEAKPETAAKRIVGAARSP